MRIAALMSLVLAMLSSPAVALEGFVLQSNDMFPSFSAGDRMVAREADFGAENLPERGAVIFYKSDATKGAVFVKRIIGVPGDRIGVADGRILLNGEMLERRDMTEIEVPAGGGTQSFARGRSYSEVLPGGRSHTIAVTNCGVGCRQNAADITVPDRSVYVLGDNRDNSLDSRHRQHGLVAISDIVGVWTLTYWDGAASRPVWRTPD